jgi:hypothetical protein
MLRTRAAGRSGHHEQHCIALIRIPAPTTHSTARLKSYAAGHGSALGDDGCFDICFAFERFAPSDERAFFDGDAVARVILPTAQRTYS